MDITIGVIIIYFILMIVMGFFWSKAKNYREFSTAKNTLLTGAVVSGLVMTHYGGGFVLGGAELGYKYGFIGVIYGLSAGLGVLLLGFFSKKIYTEVNNSNSTTISGFLYHKFKNRKMSVLSSSLSVISLTAIASAQLFAALKIFNALGIPSKTSLIILTLIVALTSTKGIKALTKSGKYNVFIASIGALVAIVIAYTIVPERIIQPSFETLSPMGVLWFVIPTLLYTVIGQDFHQKIYSAKNYKVARRACIYASFILIALSFFPMIVGFKSAFLFAGDANEAMPRFILFTMSSIFKGLFIAAILAAVVGSSQSVINAAATQVAEDLFRPFKKFSEESFGKIASISAFVLAMGAFVLTLFSSSIVNNLIIAYTIYIAGMFVPIVSAFYLKNPERISKSIFFIAVFGIIVSLVFEFNLIKISIPSVIIAIFVSSGLLFFKLKRLYFINQININKNFYN